MLKAEFSFWAISILILPLKYYYNLEKLKENNM